MRVFVFCLVCLWSFSSFAAESDPLYAKAVLTAEKIRTRVWLGSDLDPIEANLQACLSEKSDTDESAPCVGASYDAYESVLDTLLAHKSDALQTTQGKWLAYVRSDEALIHHMNEEAGRISELSVGYHNIAILRERIADLSMYLDSGAN